MNRWPTPARCKPKLALLGVGVVFCALLPAAALAAGKAGDNGDKTSAADRAPAAKPDKQPSTPAPKPHTRASFTVYVIAATKAPTDFVDPKLKALERDLGPFKARFNHFALVKAESLALSKDATGSLILPGGDTFSLTLLGIKAGRVRRARYRVAMPKFKMTRSVAPHGRTLDVVPQGDGVTIIATTVEKTSP
jgi:hypothetical protein